MNLEELLKAEPWRQGHGQPKNVLSPGWTGDEERPPCPGEIEWEGDSPFWWCTSCGYVGRATVTRHRKVQFPTEFLQRSILFFLRQRTEQGMVHEQAIAQLMYVAGVALRNAADAPPAELEKYIQQLSRT